MRVGWLVLVVVFASSLVASGAHVAATSCVSTADVGDVVVVRFAPALDPGSADLIDLLVDGPIGDLCGLEVRDGEGALRFGPLPVEPGQVVRLTSTSNLTLPDDPRIAQAIAWDASDAVAPAGRFALAKGGDSIRLHADAVVVDAVVYGDSDETQGGWQGEPVEAVSIDGRIFHRGVREGGVHDEDNAQDWTFPRIYRQHQVDRTSDWFDVDGQVRAFVCPDRCYEEVRLRIDAAVDTIDVNLYDLSLREAVDPLVEAAGRGVTVRVLLHDRPVGADDRTMDRIAWAVDRLVDAGADVRTLHGMRFNVNHAKYLVVDGAWSVALSENANRNGWAPDGVDGNRGWGVAVHDVSLAGWMTDLFVADFSHTEDSYRIRGTDLHDDAHPPVWGAVAAPAAGRLPTLVIDGGARVRPVVAPDHLADPNNSPLVAALMDAEHEVWVQQLNLPRNWSRDGFSMASPLVGTLVHRAVNEVPVRGTLAAAFQDGDITTPGNDQTAAQLSALPHARVALGDAPGGGLVHNKGWIVDPVAEGRNLVVVGSANGNLASQALNREVTLFIENALVARYYRDVLTADLARAVDAGDTPRPAPAIELPAVGLPTAVGAVLFLLAVRRRSIDMSSRLGAARRR